MARLLIAILSLGYLAGAPVKPPEKLVFETKMGNVTFDHQAHVKAAKGECATCHPKLFQQSKTAPLNFKAAMHKTAEGNKSSCGACHRPGGAAFETKANCKRCHVKT
jgi:c(7)-type cytochrome triheme protein